MTLRNMSANLIDFYNQVPLGLPGHFELIGGKRHWLDPEDTVEGDGSILNPFCTLAGAESAITAGQGDIVILRGVVNSSGSTQTARLSAALNWDKHTTALVGACAPVHVAPRARISNATTAVDLAYLVDLQASNCVWQNLHLYQGGTTAASALGTMKLSGDRNYLENIHIGQPSGSVGQAASYALTLTGSENLIVGGTIGLDTVKRTADNAVVIVDGSATRNKFKGTRFVTNAETAGYCVVRIADTQAIDRTLEFEDCLFYNFWTNHVDKISEAFEIPASMKTCDIIITGQKALLVGVDEWDSNDRGNIWIGAAAPTAATSGIAVEPAD